MKPETVYIVVHETLLQSWLKDIVTFGSMALPVWVNHTYGKGLAFIDVIMAILAVMAMIVIGGRRMKLDRAQRSFTREELKAWALSEDAR